MEELIATINKVVAGITTDDLEPFFTVFLSELIAVLILMVRNFENIHH